MKKQSSIFSTIKDGEVYDADAADRLSTNFGHYVARKTVRDTDEIVDPKSKDRIINATLSGIAAMAITPLISKYIFKQGLSIPLLIANTATSAAIGYSSPDIGNIIKREVRGDISKEESISKINEIEKDNIAIYPSIINKYASYNRLLQKESSFIGGTFSLLGKGIRGTGTAIGKGLYTGKNPNFGRKVWGATLKTGIAGGAAYGGYKGIKHLRREKSGENYTTFLRNNMLSGNIKPDQLDQQDLIGVRRLGMN